MKLTHNDLRDNRSCLRLLMLLWEVLVHGKGL